MRARLSRSYSSSGSEWKSHWVSVVEGAAYWATSGWAKRGVSQAEYPRPTEDTTAGQEGSRVSGRPDQPWYPLLPAVPPALLSFPSAVSAGCLFRSTDPCSFVVCSLSPVV